MLRAAKEPRTLCISENPRQAVFVPQRRGMATSAIGLRLPQARILCADFSPSLGSAGTQNSERFPDCLLHRADMVSQPEVDHDRVHEGTSRETATARGYVKVLACRIAGILVISPVSVLSKEASR